MSNSITPATANRLLARLAPAECQRLVALMRPVDWPIKHVIYKFKAPIDAVYFPLSGTASAITIMEDGSAIEVATIGREGILGLGVLLASDSSPNELIVQVPGEALRMDCETLMREAGQDSPLRRLLLLYNTALQTQISYSVACNGLHPIQKRCCRWLLMTRDRLDSDEVPLTHEFLAIMLGVRRASVTEVLRPLQERGLLANSRGAITILDRSGLEKEACECYRKVNEEFTRLLG